MNLEQRELIIKGPIPYGITWRLMLLKVLHRSPRPIRIFMPKLKGKGDNHNNNNNIITRLKQGEFSWVQYLMELHGG